MNHLLPMGRRRDNARNHRISEEYQNKKINLFKWINNHIDYFFTLARTRVLCSEKLPLESGEPGAEHVLQVMGGASIGAATWNMALGHAYQACEMVRVKNQSPWTGEALWHCLHILERGRAAVRIVSCSSVLDQ